MRKAHCSAGLIAIGIGTSLIMPACRLYDGDGRETRVFVKTISDFRGPDAVKSWITEDNATLKSVKQANGETAAALRLPKYVAPSPCQWPVMQLDTAHGLPKDWSDFDVLRIACRKETPLNVFLGVFFADADGNKAWLQPFLDQDAPRIIQLGLNSHRLKKLDLKRMDRLRIYVTRPAADMTLYFTSVSLVSEVPEKLRRLKTVCAAFGDNAGAARAEETLDKTIAGRLSLQEAKTIIAEAEADARVSQLRFRRGEFEKEHPRSGFAIAFADGMSRVMPQYGLIDLESAERFTICLARNEYECFQAAIIAPPQRRLKDVSVTVVPESGAPSGLSIQAAPVGFVKTRQPTYPTDYVGWYPDPILEFAEKVDVQENEVQPFWIRIFAPADIAPGDYKRELRVVAENGGPVVVPFTVKVFAFTLPRKGHLRAITSLYPSKLLPNGRKMEEACDLVLERYRVNPFSIYSGDAYGPPTIPDPSEYERRLPMGLNAFQLVYLKLPRQAMFAYNESRAKWAALSEAEKAKYPEAEARNVMRVLEKQIPELKKRGLYDLAYCYGFDEALSDEWPACARLCERIRDKFPDIKIYSTAYDGSYGSDSPLARALDGWIPRDEVYDFKKAEMARKNGKEVWWYSVKLLIDEKPLWLVRAQLGEQSFKKKVDGFLYWTLTRWNGNETPITTAPYTAWNAMSYPGHNGGGSFLCMGPDNRLLPTIRLENIRDGLEDYEYLYMLRDLAAKLPPEKNGLRAAAETILASPEREGVGALRKQRREIAGLIEKIKATIK